MKVAIPLAKNVLVPLGITAAASAIDAGIQKKYTLFWNNNFNVMKIVQALEDSNFVLKGVSKTIKNETKKQKGRYLSTLLGTLGAIIRKFLAGKIIVRASYGNKKRKGIVRTVSGKQWDF